MRLPGSRDAEDRAGPGEGVARGEGKQELQIRKQGRSVIRTEGNRTLGQGAEGRERGRESFRSGTGQ